MREGLLGGLALMMAAGLAACDDATAPRTPPIEERFNFAVGLGDWQPRAIEIEVGGEEIEWSIEHSQERALVGGASVRLFVHNRTDAARLWIEREIELEPNRDYDVRIEFAFATNDWSDVNLWRVLAGALNQRPMTAEDLVPTHQDDTRAGAPNGEGYTWQRRRYDVAIRTGGDGRAWVVIGIWGTSEFQRTYFVDDVRLIFTPL